MNERCKRGILRKVLGQRNEEEEDDDDDEEREKQDSFFFYFLSGYDLFVV